MLSGCGFDRAGHARSAQPAISIGILGQILLVIVLGIIERSGLRDFRGDPAAAVLLMAMGFDSLSMNATNLPKVKWMLRQINLGKAKELLAELMTIDNPQVIHSSLQLALKNLGLAKMVNPVAAKAG